MFGCIADFGLKDILYLRFTPEVLSLKRKIIL